MEKILSEEEKTEDKMPYKKKHRPREENQRKGNGSISVKKGKRDQH